MTRHDWMMRLYDLSLEIQDFFNDPSDADLKLLWDRAVKYQQEIESELDEGLDTDDSDDGEALASAGFGTDEDYGGSNERE